tara:strand:- start:6071 stop:6973 length:903 start_codon:yes stop_codon:yes gene_type:complete
MSDFLKKAARACMPYSTEKRRALLFSLYSYFNPLHSSNLCILATTTKTGTHYLRLALAFYLNSYFDFNLPNNEKLIDLIFPNSWHSSYTYLKKIVKPHFYHLSCTLPFSDLPRSHLPYQKVWKKRKVIHTFRNPLDQAVVSYFTKYDLDKSSTYKSPFELFVANIVSIVNEYESFRDPSLKQVFRIPFEDLLNNHRTFSYLLSFLHLPVDYAIITNAISFANSYPLAYLGAFEKWQRPDYISTRDLDSLDSFVDRLQNAGMNSAVGSYNLYFTSKQICQAKDLLLQNSASMASFYNLSES